MAFGQDTDAPYRPGSALKVSGYSLDVAADGTLALYRHDAGTAAPVRLAESGSPAPRPGEWMKFVVALGPWRHQRPPGRGRHLRRDCLRRRTPATAGHG